MHHAIQGTVFAAALVSAALSFINLLLATEDRSRVVPRLWRFALFGISTGFLLGLGISL